jgi:hypothetical protein
MARRKLPEVEQPLLDAIRLAAAKELVEGSQSALCKAWQLGYEACERDFRRGRLRPDTNPFDPNSDKPEGV